MTRLFCTTDTVNNTRAKIFTGAIDVKIIKLFGACRVTLYDSVTAATGDVKAFLCGTVNDPHDEIRCGVGEVIHFNTGVYVVAAGADASMVIQLFSMGNPVSGNQSAYP